MPGAENDAGLRARVEALADTLSDLPANEDGLRGVPTAWIERRLRTVLDGDGPPPVATVLARRASFCPEALMPDAHMSNVARIIRECANDIGMNEPRYADRLLELARLADLEAEGRFIMCYEPGCPGDGRYAPPGRGHYDHGPFPIPPESGDPQ